jgi:tetratricopeptide (TPR) repeat protein
MNNIALALAGAAKLHQAGRLDEAEPVYRECLRVRPDDPDALYLLGTVQYQRGQLGSAALLLRKAIDAQPTHLEAMHNLALVLEAQGKWEEASDYLERVVKANPKHADAHFNLGNVRRGQRRFRDAVACYDRAIALRTGWAEAYDNRGVAYRELGEWEHALTSCQRAVKLSPRHVGAQNNLGAVYKGLGEYALASEAFARAVNLDPTCAVAESNLGMTQAHLRNFESALTHCQRAVAMNPTLATARNNLGLVYFLTGRESESAVEFQNACQLDPDFADAHNNLASALFRMDQIESAVAHYRRSAELKPAWLTERNLGSILEQACHWQDARDAYVRAAKLKGNDPFLALRSAIVCPTLFESTSAIDAYRDSLVKALDETLSQRPTQSPAVLIDEDIRPSFAWQFQGWDDRPMRERLGRIVANSFEDDRPRPRREKPAVGFVVSQGHEYGFVRSIGGFFTQFRRKDWRPVLLCSERAQQTIRSTIADPALDIIPLPDRWQEAVDRIASARLDMLYHWEVATGAFNYLLPFCRLAPQQCTSWGIQVTSGIPAIDYYVSSEQIESAEADGFYTEKLVRLKTLLSYQQPMSAPSRTLRVEEIGLDPSAHVYLCAQQLGKFHPAFDPILAEILDADPRGVLVVTASRFEPENAALQSRWRTTLGPVTQRIRWIPKQAGDRYASLIANARVILDPIQFGGVNTTYDAIAMGKVTVTWPTRFNKGRYTSACYRAIGAAEGIVASSEEYVEQAVRLATDDDYRHALEKKVVQGRDAIFRCASAAWELEDWFVETIEQHRSKDS